MISVVKAVVSFVVTLAALALFSLLMALAITSPDNPINKAWATYVCSEHMTKPERRAETRCP